MAFARNNSTVFQRTDDFRCHDSSLVKIDPTKIDDAYHCAKDLHEKGIVSGLYISGDDFPNLDFVERFNFLDSFYFHDLTGGGVRRFNFSKICNARVLSLRGEKVEIDLTNFKRLEELYCNWFDGVNLLCLSSLRLLQLFSLNCRDDYLSINLPESITNVELIRVKSKGLLFPNAMPCLERFGLYYSSGVHDLAGLVEAAPNLAKVHLENVVGDFDYSCLACASSLRELWIEKCVRVSDWKFIRSLSLERFVLQQTKYEDVDFSNEEFSRIGDLHVPKQRRSADSKELK